MSESNAARIRDNLAGVRRRMADAATAAGRKPEEVQLIAVTKYVDVAATALVVAAGCRHLGESRPQQIWEKYPALHGRDVRWHLIGHLQRNKIRRTLPMVELFHAGDSLRLLSELNDEAAKLADQAPAHVLLEVNVSGDAAKHGFAPAELPRLADELAQFAHVDIRGLMTMTGLDADSETERRQFAELRELRDALRRDWSGRFALDELSMGMSGDFEAAIAEGATMVRVGSALFEGIDTGHGG